MALNLLDRHINYLTNSFNESVRETAEEVIGCQRKQHQPWISDILDLCDKRKTLTKNSSRESATEYYKTNNQICKQIEGSVGMLAQPTV